MPSRSQLLYLPQVLTLRERYIVFVFSVIGVCALLAIPVSSYYHFTHPVAAYGGTLSEGILGSPIHINPLLAQNDAERDVTSLVYSGLMKYNENGTLVNDLAESYSVSDDGLTYVFTLKPNLLWHDGKNLTSDDIVFTILTVQNSSYNSPDRVNWQSVDIAKKDERTVVFSLKNKYAQFLNNMTLGIMPKHIWEGVSPTNFSLTEYNIKPIGSGPYQFSALTKHDDGTVATYDLVSFKSYHEGKAFISKINLKFYNNEDDLINAYNDNEVKEISTVSIQKIDSLKYSTRLNLHEIKLPRFFAIFFNENENKILADKAVRTSLNYGIDKAGLVQNVLKGHAQVVDSPLMPGILSIAPLMSSYSYDPAKAKKTLENDQWLTLNGDIREKKENGSKKAATKLSVEITTVNVPDLIATANNIKQQWKDIGVDVTLKILSIPELQKVIKSRDYEAILFGEVLNIDPDPFSFWHSSQQKDPGLNLSLYEDEDVDNLLEKGQKTLLTSDRADVYSELQETIVGDAPAVFLYSPYYIYPQSSAVQGNNMKIINTPSSRFANINKWFISTGRGWGRSK